MAIFWWDAFHYHGPRSIPARRHGTLCLISSSICPQFPPHQSLHWQNISSSRWEIQAVEVILKNNFLRFMKMQGRRPFRVHPKPSLELARPSEIWAQKRNSSPDPTQPLKQVTDLSASLRSCPFLITGSQDTSGYTRRHVQTPWRSHFLVSPDIEARRTGGNMIWSAQLNYYVI